MPTEKCKMARRIKALEGMLVCYRLGKRPSERLFTELEKTEDWQQESDDGK